MKIPASVHVPSLVNARALDKAYEVYFGSYEVFEEALSRRCIWRDRGSSDSWEREIDELIYELHKLSPWEYAGFIDRYLLALINR